MILSPPAGKVSNNAVDGGLRGEYDFMQSSEWLAIDLEESARSWIFANLPHDRADTAIAVALRAKRTGELLTLYFNWADRLIPAIPRQIMRSDVFDKNCDAIRRSAAINAIIADVECGRDLTKYLSRRVKIGFVPPPNAAKKQLNTLLHLDLLMNEWGVHHLHISTTVEDDGFVERDDPLLFAIFRQDRAYLLDVGSHATFADSRLVRIAVEAWPEAGLFHELKDIRPGRGQPYTTEDRGQLRKAGLASFVQIEDKLYAPPGGISTAGTSIASTRRANLILRTMAAFERQLETDPQVFRRFLSDNGINEDQKVALEFAIFSPGFGVIEKNSQTPIRLG